MVDVILKDEVSGELFYFPNAIDADLFTDEYDYPERLVPHKEVDY